MKLEKLNNHLTSPPTKIRLLSKDINIKTKVSESGHKIRKRTLNISRKVKCESITVSHVQLFLTPWTGAYQLLCPWNSPGQNTGVSCHFLLHGIVSTQGLNLYLPYWRQILYHLSHQGNPGKREIYYSVSQFNSSVVSDSLQPHRLQHTRPPWPSPIPGVYSNSIWVHWVHWVSNAIQSSHPLSSPSPPTFSHSQHQALFKWVSSSHEVAKVLEFQLQHQSFQWIFRTDLL